MVSGEHTAHIANAVYGCADCHAKSVIDDSTLKAAPTAHQNGTYGDYSGARAGGSYAAGSCSNVYCHTDGKGGAPAVAVNWLTGPALDCKGCHGAGGSFGEPAYVSGNSHAKHVSSAADCASCHYATTADGTTIKTGGSHTNKVINVDGSSSIGFDGGAKTCSTASCHADPYSSGTATTPAWGTSAGCAACHTGANVITANGPATGNHTNVTGHAVACITCHGAGTTATTKPTVGHADGDIDTANVGYPADKAKGSAGASCSTASCHANPYGTGSVATPNWGTTGNGCAACHTGANVITANGPATGNHTNVTGHAVACITCHETGTTDTTKPTVGHADGNIDTANVGYPADKVKGSAGASCSTASCHANPYVVGGFVTTPAWGTTLSNKCDACHVGANVITANGPATGGHTAHAGKACTECHAAGTSATTTPTIGHNNNNIDVVNFSYPATVIKHTAGTGYSTCSNISCHSGNGKFTPAPALWGSTLNCKGCHATLSAGHTPHTSTLLDDRANTLVYDRYSANASSGGTYKFGCANCHPVTISSHMNNTVDVDLTTTAGSGALKAKNGAASINGSKQCLNVYCHSNGYSTTPVFATTPAWGSAISGDKCAACHGNSPSASGQIAGSGAHAAHVVGIHYQDLFNGTSRKLPVAAATGGTINAAHGTNSRSTTINCNICHNDTITTFANDNNAACVTCHTTGNLKNPASLIANTSFHVNGQVNVKFADTKLVSKAQVANKAFSRYTAASEGGWTRNNGLYKNFTSAYDVTKTTLFSTAGFAGGNCTNVACHAGKAVTWTATGFSCNNCHSSL